MTGYAYRAFTASVAFVVVCCAAGCSLRESDERIRRKLDTVLADDLAYVVSELPPESVRDNPEYVLRDYKTFRQGKFGALAVVDFYFIKQDPAIMVRKYRYHMNAGQWERYINTFRLVHDSGAADASR